jgi:adenine-specific DNA-methyltransferase
MEKIENGHPLSQSTDFVAQNIETLKALFPTIVKEGKIDIKELQALLGTEVESDDEYYRFNWAGKSMARREANKPSTATLRPDKESSKDWDTTHNIFIEGDNLEVLKLLQKSYANKIKMIYIDPPYNTGKDFVYKDNYNDNLGNYLSITGQIDQEGKRINTNSESDGRYHSNWLSMMYPRLRLARNLMTDDGVIFISIDDNEYANLKKINDEIFGEENFISSIIWKRKRGRDNSAKFISKSHEYLLIFAKSIVNLHFNKLDLDEETLKAYKNSDNDSRGVYRILGVWARGTQGGSRYSYTNNDGVCYDERLWLMKEENLRKLENENKLIFNGDKVYRKLFLDENEGNVADSLWDDVSNAANAADEIKKIFGEIIFDTPKPIPYLMKMLKIGADNNDIILDFFGGSASTPHAVLQLNSEDGGNRKFFCVQLPEPTDEKSEAYKAGYKTISDITKERIRRAGEKIKSEMKQDLFSEQGKTLDIGFRAFKLDSSNIRAWDGNPDALEDNLFNAGSNIKENRTEEDVLYEILLKYGLDLTMPIEHKEIAGKQVFNIGMGALFICLGDKLTTAIAEGIGKWKEELKPATTKVIFKDTGFTDVEKTNSMQILKRFGIQEINTI